MAQFAQARRATADHHHAAGRTASSLWHRNRTREPEAQAITRDASRQLPETVAERGFGARSDSVARRPLDVTRVPVRTDARATTSYGRCIEPEPRALMESGFQHDFRHVRVFADHRASQVVDSVGARAVTVGSSILFGSGQYAPHTPAGRSLLAHELAHVVQASGSGAGRSGRCDEAAVEADADRAAGAVLAGRTARPALAVPLVPHYRRWPGKVPGGEYTVDMDEKPGTAGLKESVRIEFMPDKSGPVTDKITFLQIAQTRTGGKALPWAPQHRGEEIVDRIRTREGTGEHLTKLGDTLASVSTAHYGVPDKAAELFAANRILGVSSDPNAALPVGQRLTLPGAVQGDYSLDIDPAQVKPRKQPGDPNVSGNYPHLATRNRTTKADVGGGLVMTTVTPESAIGRNPKGGTPESAIMTDDPGGGSTVSTFRFETTAHAEDIGHSYGAVQWGFNYDPSNTGSGRGRHITNEFVHFRQHVTDTVNAAVVAFNKDVGNRHVVQEGETLLKISLMYFHTGSRADALFRLNPGILPRYDPNASLPPGKELELPKQ